MSATFLDALTHLTLDRAAPRRGDTHWIAAHLASDASLFVPVWRGQVLLQDIDGQPRAVFLSGDAARKFRLAGGPWVFLGCLGDTALFCVDVSEVEDPIPLLPHALASFGELRPIVGLLPPEEAGVLGHARALMHWRGRHKFCGICGTACAPGEAGNVLKCPHCGTTHFPRTDPAVIMLVSRRNAQGEPELLLAKPRRAGSANIYTVLAGFVEPGENLEQAVTREVLEETGVAVRNVRYFASQSWPFPASLMVGFMAEAVSETITMDDQELAGAGWYPRTAVLAPEEFGITLPQPVTIARQLMNAWAGG